MPNTASRLYIKVDAETKDAHAGLQKVGKQVKQLDRDTKKQARSAKRAADKNKAAIKGQADATATAAAGMNSDLGKVVLGLKAVRSAWIASGKGARIAGNMTKAALISTGIGAIVVALGVAISAVVASLSRFQSGIDKMQPALRFLSELLGNVIDNFARLGEVITSSLKVATNWTRALFGAQGAQEDLKKSQAELTAANEKFNDSLRTTADLEGNLEASKRYTAAKDAIRDAEISLFAFVGLNKQFIAQQQQQAKQLQTAFAKEKADREALRALAVDARAAGDRTTELEQLSAARNLEGNMRKILSERLSVLSAISEKRENELRLAEVIRDETIEKLKLEGLTLQDIKDIAAQKKNINELEKGNVRLTQNLRDFLEQYFSAQARVAEKTEQITKLEKERKTLEGDRGSLEAKNASLRTELANTEKTITAERQKQLEVAEEEAKLQEDLDVFSQAELDALSDGPAEKIDELSDKTKAAYERNKKIAQSSQQAITSAMRSLFAGIAVSLAEGSFTLDKGIALAIKTLGNLGQMLIVMGIAGTKLKAFAAANPIAAIAAGSALVALSAVATKAFDRGGKKAIGQSVGGGAGSLAGSGGVSSLAGGAGGGATAVGSSFAGVRAPVPVRVTNFNDMPPALTGDGIVAATNEVARRAAQTAGAGSQSFL